MPSIDSTEDGPLGKNEEAEEEEYPLALHAQRAILNLFGCVVAIVGFILNLVALFKYGRGTHDLQVLITAIVLVAALALFMSSMHNSWMALRCLEDYLRYEDEGE